MSIDEAIAKYKEITNTDAICPGHCNIPCEKCVQESEQLVEWLKELKVYQQHKIICNKGYNAGYNKAIDDYTEKAKAECKAHYVDCDPYFGGIEDSILYEYDIDEIAEQLKASDTNE